MFISSFVLIVGLISIFTFGFTYSIEFTGGTILHYRLNDRNVKEQEIRSLLKKSSIKIEDFKFINSVVELKTKPLTVQDTKTIKKQLEKLTGKGVDEIRKETIGPVLGKEMVIKTIYGTIIAIIGILLYLSFSFRGVTFAFAAILALFHDAFIMIGLYSLMGRLYGAQVDSLFITALLTTMSFSVHDTIVVFDKIRELKKSERAGEIYSCSNAALSQTMVRSINNSMTIVFMLLSLLLMGGSMVRFFAASLLIGTITGTYSSPFVATPLLVWLERRKNR